jgi:8-oxo-dGTP diphosphatase
MTSIVVTAAVIERDGRFLVTRRLKGVHLEGYWEFPGGKCDPGETLERCLLRELREELAVDAVIGEEMLSTSHSYPERRVELHFFRVTLNGPPAPTLGQEMRWVARADLPTLELPPADDELVALLMGDKR